MANQPKAPTVAPTQTVVPTGEGNLPRGATPPAGGLAPPPRHAPTTGPTIPRLLEAFQPGDLYAGSCRVDSVWVLRVVDLRPRPDLTVEHDREVLRRRT